MPGLAKTLMIKVLMIKALTSAFRRKYGRVRFTSDSMPADVTGYELLGRSPSTSEGDARVLAP